MASRSRKYEFVVDPDGFSAALGEILQEYEDRLYVEVEKATKDAAKLMVKETKVRSPVRGGAYRGGITEMQTRKTRSEVVHTWHVKGRHSSLSHLLEYGHALRQGGRAKAYPHIRPAFAIVEPRYLEALRKAALDAAS